MIAFLEGWMWLVWLIFSCLAAWVTLVLCYIAVVTAKVKIENGDTFHWFFSTPVYVGFLIGIILDVVWNFTGGIIAFQEMVKLRDGVEWTFTARCKRHKEKNDPNDWRYNRAVWWCDELNKWHEGHC